MDQTAQVLYDTLVEIMKLSEGKGGVYRKIYATANSAISHVVVSGAAEATATKRTN
jgi:hypothetical protein